MERRKEGEGEKEGRTVGRKQENIFTEHLQYFRLNICKINRMREIKDLG